MNAITKTITSREDLSFTSRDEKGRFLNWNVPHDQSALWGEGKKHGMNLFCEVAILAEVDELEAFHAITFAMNTRGWQSSGWGIEGGFSDALAAFAIVGLRAVRNGAEGFDIGAAVQRRCDSESAAFEAEAKALDDRVQAAARKAGLTVRKCRRKESVDNRGGYMLVVPGTNTIAAGERFDLTAAEAIAYCGETGSAP